MNENKALENLNRDIENYAPATQPDAKAQADATANEQEIKISNLEAELAMSVEANSNCAAALAKERKKTLSKEHRDYIEDAMREAIERLDINEMDHEETQAKNRLTHAIALLRGEPRYGYALDGDGWKDFPAPVPPELKEAVEQALHEALDEGMILVPSEAKNEMLLEDTQNILTEYIKDNQETYGLDDLEDFDDGEIKGSVSLKIIELKD